MKKKIMDALAVCLGAFCLFSSCGESSEEIAMKLDHSTPTYTVLTDSLLVSPLQEVTVKVEISDNAGLKKLLFEYGSWSINQSISLEDSPKSYLFEARIVVPADAEKEWEEERIENDGTLLTVKQTYHRLTITATDVNMNVRAIPIYIKVM